jgi:conjugative relaxase-like TrwC/TraI family protein
MMTLHKLHAGDGYTYLTRQVAAGDEGRSPGQQLADYYTASGNPPGRWLGAGADDLAVHGRVFESQMRALFGRGMHPDAEQIIALELASGGTQADAERAGKLGRAFPNYTTLEARSERVARRLTEFRVERGREPSKAERSRIEAQEARKDRHAVAGYDLVFTPVKSASLLWALGSAATREHVEAAHHEAVTETLAWLERETAFARIGNSGEAQVDTRGFIAAAFDHRDSRAGDPDLHTHLAISNKVRATRDYPDGRPRWLSLDARVIHAAAVAASERYNTRFEDALARRLGVDFVERADSRRTDKRVVREVAGFPDELIRHFSRRRAAIEDRYRELTADYRSRHGHEPPRDAQLRLAQQATLETREAKSQGSSLADKIARWRAEAAKVVGAATFATLEARCLHRNATTTRPIDVPVDDIAARVVAVVSEEKTTWTKWNLLAETERQLRSYRFPAPGDRDNVTTLVVDRALSPDVSICLAVEDQTIDPPELRRASGESVFTEHGAARYTTQDLLDAERRLLTTAQQPTRYGITPAAVTELIGAFERRYGITLDHGQRTLVHGFTGDPRRLVVGIGPAGAGKTTAMRAVAEAWTTTGRRVVPLAPSAAAAQVLAKELDCRAENLHKFHHAHSSGRAADDSWFVLQPGDLVLVDEAGMAGTRRLDWLVTYAREQGAVIRLLGDPSQMSAVEAGGALRLLVHDVGAVELTDLHRFSDPSEAKATLALRDGHNEALDFYFAHDRVTSGTADAMLDAGYESWAHDIRRGKHSLLIAGNNADVIALNARARRDRVDHGDVRPDGVTLHDGNTASVGDRVVTRANQRTLITNAGRDFVKNGDTWTVHQKHRNGDLTVEHTAHHGKIRLPAEYVSTDLELGYACTATRAQGMTVDTAHVLVDEATTRETLYVAATRGRDGARLYVATNAIMGIDAERPPAPELTARQLLEETLAREGGERSATEVAREAHRQAAELTRARTTFRSLGVNPVEQQTRAVRQALAARLAEQVITDSAFPALARTLQRAHDRGYNTTELLLRAASRRELDSAESVAQVLQYRVELMTHPRQADHRPAVDARPSIVSAGPSPAVTRT